MEMRTELIKYIHFGFVPTLKYSAVIVTKDCYGSCKGYHILAPFL